MEIDEVKALKSDILKNLLEDAPGTKVLPQSFNADFGELRRRNLILSVGYSRHSADDYQLELRVKSKRGAASALGQSIKERYPNNVNVAVLSRITAPLPEAQSTSEFAKSLQSKKTPLVLGSSVSHFDGKTGTLGGFLFDPNDGCKYVLSCNHVFALCNEAKEGDKVLHPGSDDSPSLAANKIGELSSYVSYLTENTQNGSDSALARLDDHINVSGNIIPDGMSNSGELVLPLVNGYPVEGAVVEKVGRTTGHTKGTVNSVSLDNVEVEYNVVVKGRSHKRTYVFDNVIEIKSHDRKTPFSLRGDSGSLVYSRIGEKLYGLGMVFAGAQFSDWDGQGHEPVTLCCTLRDILTKYDELEWMR